MKFHTNHKTFEFVLENWNELEESFHLFNDTVKSGRKPLDYEDPIQRDGFTLGIRVYDGRYYATTK
ncbi:unnamed protein product, partial [Brugia timori]|uniref:Phage protein n=1 Tax=Brugia timori TaxID=42155 RepID=A0A0R3R9Y8_9BILA